MLKKLVVLLVLFASLGLAQSFEDVFGPRPVGPATQEMKYRRLVWDQQKSQFDGAVDLDVPVEALVLYDQVGLGLPVAWRQKGTGKVYVAFPGARYFRPVYVPASTATGFAGVVWRTWHLDSVAKGWCISELNQNFPARVVAENLANCSVKE